MVKLTPCALNYEISKATSENGMISSGYSIGITFPKGTFLHFFGPRIFISKDGINETLGDCYNEKKISLFFLSRLYGLIDTILFFISLPFMLVLYSLFAITCLLVCIVMVFTLPFKFTVCKQCIGNDTINNRALCLSALLFFFQALYTLLLCVIYTITTPIQIIVPEFTAFVIKHHKWNTLKFSYFS